MDSHPHDFEGLHDRLVRLENQNRRFKQVGVAGLVFASLLVMGQAPAKETVEANEFLLRDASGNIRARLSVEDMGIGGTPQMVFLDTKGNTNLTLNGSVEGFPGGSGGALLISNLQGHSGIAAALSSTSLGGFFSIYKGSSKVSLVPGKVDVVDDQGFEAVVGTQELVTPHTGETHTTSAASLVLFDKDKNLIWKAP
jgi:hypothetical protein